MEIAHYTDAVSFLDAVGLHLVEDVPRNQLILSIAETVIDQPDVYPEYHAWQVFEGTRTLAAASCTPPYNYLLADAAETEAVSALVAAISGSGVTAPGVIGNVPTVQEFVDLWAVQTGVPARGEMSQGVFALESVEPLELANGSNREATPADRDLLLDWWLAFLQEATPGVEVSVRVVAERVEQRLDQDRPQGVGLWVTEGEVVSMCGYSPPVANSVRIGPVYTPSELRGNGYATALVATQSGHHLAKGRDRCLLYTDLANPTSNAIYKRIGYRQVAESVVHRFRPDPN